MFGDYYAVAKIHNEKLVGENSFWIGRVYPTFDQTASSHFINSGLDFKVGPDIGIVPNFESVLHYKSKRGTRPGSDFYSKNNIIL